MFRYRLLLFSTLCCLIFVSITANATVDLSPYALKINAHSLKIGTTHDFDSLIQHSPIVAQTKRMNCVMKPHYTESKTLDFYLLLSLCAILGSIKTIHPKYFNDVWRAFINPTLGSRQLKDMIQSASFPNLLMNLFSCIVLGTYVFYLISIDRDWRFAGMPSSMVVSLLIVGSVILYTGKYLFVQFTGWAFNIRSTSEQYNFNIFLVNKIVGIVLLPFIICFAFLNKEWQAPLCITSLVLLVVLLMNRYVRSWNIFAHFFMNSRFHFFMYLCAFEILPMAILLKMVVRIL
jgi:hypothetical protein